MRQYIGNKMIHASPMTLGEYNVHRGWVIPKDEDPDREGYNVHYSNDYQSWSPKDIFDDAYLPTDEGLPFSIALEAIKRGHKVSRIGWNGVGMFVFLVDGSTFRVNRPPLLGIYPEGTKIHYLPHVDMRTASGEIVPWLASQSDILSHDWTIHE